MSFIVLEALPYGNMTAQKGSIPVPKVEASFTDPDASRVDTPNGTWFLMGIERVDEGSLEMLVATGDAADFCQSHRDALVVFIEHTNGEARSLQVWRGIFSGRELFFAVRRTGDVVLSDHFRNVLAALPRSDRMPDERILTAHYLFRKPHGRMTYSKAITRVSHAEHLVIDPRTSEVQWSLFDQVDASPDHRSTEEYVSAIDASLKGALDRVPEVGSTALMFSGGVDSTLLMTYVPESVRAVTFVPDTPEFGPETNYARDAASMLGIGSDEIPYAESDFLEMLETITDMAGTPLFDDATPYFGNLIREQPYDSFVTGEGGDSAFGISLKLARISSWFRFPVVREALGAAAPHVPGQLGYRMRQIVPIAAGFAKSPLSPDGYAGNARTFGDTSLFQSLVDTSLVEELKMMQLDYVTQRVKLGANPASVFQSHIEVAHWMILFGNPCLFDRLIAHACGKRILSPYLDGPVLAELTRVPVEERYIRGLRAKWILKDLLARRLPPYPTNQRKKATALPYERFYRAGPLTTIWNDYDVPAIFTGAKRDELVREPSTSTWNAITYAIWKQRVAENPDLRPHAAKVTASFDVIAG